MAFWQYLFRAIPKDSLVKKYGIISKEITEGDFNDLDRFDEFNKDGLIINKIFTYQYTLA